MSVRVRARLVDLVDRDDDRNLRLLGVVDRLDGLRHRAVVGGDDQHDDVRHLGAAGAHRGEGLVARRIEEHDVAPIARDLVGADVLGDAAGLAGGDVRLADRVEQRRLAVVDVTHDRDDRRARHHVLGVVRRLGVDQDLVLAERRRLDLEAELGRDDRRGVEIDVLVDVDFHHPERPELLDDLAPLDRHLLGELGDRDGVGHADDALVLGRGGDLRLLELLPGGRDLLLREGARTVAARTERGPTEAIAPGRRAADEAGAAEALLLGVAIPDLDAGRGRLAARGVAGQLDERARRRRSGHDRLRDGPHRGMRSAGGGGTARAPPRRRLAASGRRRPCRGGLGAGAACSTRRRRGRRRAARRRARDGLAARPAARFAPCGRRAGAAASTLARRSGRGGRAPPPSPGRVRRRRRDPAATPPAAVFERRRMTVPST